MSRLKIMLITLAVVWIQVFSAYAACTGSTAAHPDHAMNTVVFGSANSVNPQNQPVTVGACDGVVISPSLQVATADIGKTATLVCYVYLPDPGFGMALPSQQVTLGQTTQYTILSNGLNLSTLEGLQFWIYVGYLLTDGTIRYNAYSVTVAGTNTGKRVEVITDSTSPLLIMFTDNNDRSYWFFAERDDDGMPEYINELMITELINNKMEERLTINFDNLQRAVTVVLPDQQGKMSLDYVSPSEVKITVMAPDGTTESVTVPNPYNDVTTRNQFTSLLVDAMCQDWADFPPDIYENWSGVIKACKDGTKPIVVINKLNPQNNYLIDSTYLAKVKAMDQTILPGFYEYSYGVQWLDNYDKWESYCRCMKNIGAGLLAGDTFPVFSAIHYGCQYLEACVKDFFERSKVNSSKVTTSKIADIFTEDIASIIKETAEYIKYSGDPCSHNAFTDLEKKILQPIEIEVRYKTKEKSVEFDPEMDNEIPQISFAELCFPDHSTTWTYSLTEGGTLYGNRNGSDYWVANVNQSKTIDKTDRYAHRTFASLYPDGRFKVNITGVVAINMGIACTGWEGYWEGTYTTGSNGGSLNIEKAYCMVGPDDTADGLVWLEGSGTFTSDKLTFNASFKLHEMNYRYELTIYRKY